MVREPAVAGQFYPGNGDELRSLVEGFLGPFQAEEPALGIVSPHAGYVYSGAIAGMTFSGVRVPETVLVLGPNHHGYGSPAAVYASGAWQTPLGEILIDESLAEELLAECPILQPDEVAHRFEHSLEVQVPFVQVKSPTAKILPVCLGRGGFDQLLEIGQALGRVLKRSPGKVLMVASSDMTHYEPGEVARQKDMRALDRVLDLDPQGLYQVVTEGQISMCGMIPTVVMLAAAKELGASEAKLVHYGNSGDVTGDQSEVVGYAGVVVK